MRPYATAAATFASGGVYATVDFTREEATALRNFALQHRWYGGRARSGWEGDAGSPSRLATLRSLRIFEVYPEVEAVVAAGGSGGVGRGSSSGSTGETAAAEVAAASGAAATAAVAGTAAAAAAGAAAESSQEGNDDDTNNDNTPSDAPRPPGPLVTLDGDTTHKLVPTAVDPALLGGLFLRPADEEESAVLELQIGAGGLTLVHSSAQQLNLIRR